MSGRVCERLLSSIYASFLLKLFYSSARRAARNPVSTRILVPAGMSGRGLSGSRLSGGVALCHAVCKVAIDKEFPIFPQPVIKRIVWHFSTPSFVAWSQYSIKQKTPFWGVFQFCVGRAGFEPATVGLKGHCSTN